MKLHVPTLSVVAADDPNSGRKGKQRSRVKGLTFEMKFDAVLEHTC